jgi:DNA-binding NtrC family response regulator
MLDDELHMAARIRVPVLITAESREQRETSARRIHTDGNNMPGPFVVFPSDAAGANVEGAHLSSAVRARDDGVTLRQQFEEALGGTLFIEDIARLTRDAQAQLCCLLEEYQLRMSTVSTDGPSVRVIAGASRHLDAERAAGAFCEPLFYRLNVIHIDLISPRTRRCSP